MILAQRFFLNKLDKIETRFKDILFFQSSFVIFSTYINFYFHDI